MVIRNVYGSITICRPVAWPKCNLHACNLCSSGAQEAWAETVQAVWIAAFFILSHVDPQILSRLVGGAKRCLVKEGSRITRVLARPLERGFAMRGLETH